MPYHVELLKQSRRLLALDNKPGEATLRRAVSTAYYALFHLLVRDAAVKIAGQGAPHRLVAALSRTFDHATMLDVAKAFAQPELPPKLGHPKPVRDKSDEPAKPAPNLPALMEIAELFARMQDARHNADYNLAVEYSPREVLDMVDDVEQAFAKWNGVRQKPESREFLLALAFWKGLREPRETHRARGAPSRVVRG